MMDDERLTFVGGLVAGHFDVTLAQLLDGKNSKSTNNARAVAMVLLEDLFYFSAEELAGVFNRSQRAVCQAFRKVREDADLRQLADELAEAERRARRERSEAGQKASNFSG